MLKIALMAGFVALQGAEVYPVSGPPVTDATVLVYGEKVINVGKTGSFKIPKSAKIVDVSGKVITPGLVHAYSQLGLVEVSAVSESNDGRLNIHEDKRKNIHAAYRVVDEINPYSSLIPIARSEGITTALVVPDGGLISGRAAWVDLHGDARREMVVRPYAAMVADVRRGRGGTGGRGGAWMTLRELLFDTRAYARRRRSYEQNQSREMVATRLDLEAMLPVIRGQRPLIIVADRASDIRTALQVAKEYRLKLILKSAVEGWLVADEIAAADVPVIVDYPRDLPGSFDTLAARLDNPARLAAAGVKIALVPSGWATGAHQAGRLRQEAANAVVDGLRPEDALRAITASPAEIFGIGNGVGTLAPNSPATFVVWSGDPFLVSSEVEQVFVRGEPAGIENRQHELFERYEDFPPAKASSAVKGSGKTKAAP